MANRIALCCHGSHCYANL